MQLGLVIRDARIARGLTLKQLSADIGLTLPTLHQLEKGRPMDGKTLAAVLRWLMQEAK